ncbi:type VI secretion system baseplate subunit TssF [Sphingomonas sp. MMS24-JH45]
MKLPIPSGAGFDDDCALLPPDLRTFRGYRLLSEYFACPERFLFATLCGSRPRVRVGRRGVRRRHPARRADPTPTGAIGAANFRLFATPAINLFEKQLGRVPLTTRTAEHQLIADRTKPLDYEIFRVLEVTAYADANADPRAGDAAYAAGAGQGGGAGRSATCRGCECGGCRRASSGGGGAATMSDGDVG